MFGEAAAVCRGKNNSDLVIYIYIIYILQYIDHDFCFGLSWILGDSWKLQFWLEAYSAIIDLSLIWGHRWRQVFEMTRSHQAIWVWINTYYIPFLVGWTSIYQLFWCSPGVQGFDTLPYNAFLSCTCDWVWTLVYAAGSWVEFAPGFAWGNGPTPLKATSLDIVCWLLNMSK